MITEFKVRFYIDENGDLRNLIQISSRSLIGELSGVLNSYDHTRRVKVRGETYLAHRIVYCINNGREPKYELCLINGCYVDMRRTGKKILKIRKDNDSGVTGVYYSRAQSCYRASIFVNGGHHNLGSFQNIDDAKIARRRAEKLYGFI